MKYLKHYFPELCMIAWGWWTARNADADPYSFYSFSVTMLSEMWFWMLLGAVFLNAAANNVFSGDKDLQSYSLTFSILLDLVLIVLNVIMYFKLPHWYNALLMTIYIGYFFYFCLIKLPQVEPITTSKGAWGFSLLALTFTVLTYVFFYQVY